MTKRVVVIASGETERRALPHLTRHLADRASSSSSWISTGPTPTPPWSLFGVGAALVSAEIARTLDAGTIAGRSPSFRKFAEAVLNGASE